MHPVARPAARVIGHRVAARVDRHAAGHDVTASRADERQAVDGDRSGAGARQGRHSGNRGQAAGLVVDSTGHAVVGAADRHRAAAHVFVIRAAGRCSLGVSEAVGAGPGVCENLRFSRTRAGVPGEHQLWEHQLPRVWPAAAVADERQPSQRHTGPHGWRVARGPHGRSAGGVVVGGGHHVVTGAADRHRATAHVLMGDRAGVQRDCERGARYRRDRDRPATSTQAAGGWVLDLAAQAVGAEADYINLSHTLPDHRIGADTRLCDVENRAARGSRDRERVGRQAGAAHEVVGACRQRCRQRSHAGLEHHLIIGAQPVSGAGECVGGVVDRDGFLNPSRPKLGHSRLTREHRSRAVAISH